MRQTRARQVANGEFLPPWFYGFSYIDYPWDLAIFYPIPLNLLVRWGRQLRFWWDDTRSGQRSHYLLTSDDLERMRQDSYERGRHSGWIDREREIVHRLAEAALSEDQQC